MPPIKELCTRATTKLQNSNTATKENLTPTQRKQQSYDRELHPLSPRLANQLLWRKARDHEALDRRNDKELR